MGYFHDKKDQHNQLKRELKRAGNRKRRRHLQRDLRDNPGAAHESEFEFGRLSSEYLNGNDHDSKRKRHQKTDEPSQADEPTGDEEE